MGEPNTLIKAVETASSASNTIKMVENAMTVLDTLRFSGQSMGVNEIAKTTSLSPATTFRILKTLSKTGWAFQLSNDRYTIGEKFSFTTEKTNLYLAISELSSRIEEKKHEPRRKIGFQQNMDD